MTRGLGKCTARGRESWDTREFKGDSIKNLGVRDIRFTRNKAVGGTVVYALVLGWPAGEFVVQSLGTASSAQIHRKNSRKFGF